jgi:hypothetical protein
VIRLLRPRNRRRGSGDGFRGRTPRVLRRVLPGALVVAVALAVWPALRDAARRHPYFALREVVVRGQVRLAPDRVRAVAGLEPGTSVWDVDVAAAEARLRREPWVRRARVRRQLPHRVLVQLREERPVAILAVTEPAPGLYYVAGHGRIVAPLAPDDPRDFPYVTGLRAGDVSGEDPFGAGALRRALALVRLSVRGGLGPVSEIHVDRTRGLTVLPVAPAIPIVVGWGGFTEKLGRLPTVLALWVGREAELAEVSLLFTDDVIVRTRPGRPARRPART